MAAATQACPALPVKEKPKPFRDGEEAVSARWGWSTLPSGVEQLCPHPWQSPWFSPGAVHPLRRKPRASGSQGGWGR